MRFQRTMDLHFKKVYVIHPKLKAMYLSIHGVKKNPSFSLCATTLSAITKGTVIEVNMSELDLVTQKLFGQVIWEKHAQVANNPKDDGYIYVVLPL